MKKISIFIFAIIASISALCQTNIQIGDDCFNNGNYDCAITNYNKAFKIASGKDKQIADIKLSKAKRCAGHIKAANQDFDDKNYSSAKDNYQFVLESNPKDNFVRSQIEKCDKALNQPKLRKATTAELTDIWDNKYGVTPQRRQNLINAGIDPDDAQKRINAGEGKPQEKQATYLSLSTQNLFFESSGGVKIITVNTNSESFDVKLFPSWCTVNKSGSTFSVSARANYGNSERDDWFKVYAGGQELKVTMIQKGASAGRTTSASNSSTRNKKSSANSNNCFNCPTAYYPWGISIGYINKNMSQDDMYTYSYDDLYYFELIEIKGIRLGIKYEPLFKYGFGLNTGIFYEYFSQTLDEELGGDFGMHFDYDYYDYEQHVINVPLHLEYRLNFSKYFNLFVFGGAGFDCIWDSYSSEMGFKTSIEYGGGLRIDHFQFTLGQSSQIKDIRDYPSIDYFKENIYKKFMFSFAYMF